MINFSSFTIFFDKVDGLRPPSLKPFHFFFLYFFCFCQNFFRCIFSDVLFSHPLMKIIYRSSHKERRLSFSPCRVRLSWVAILLINHPLQLGCINKEGITIKKKKNGNILQQKSGALQVMSSSPGVGYQSSQESLKNPGIRKHCTTVQ